MSTVTEIETAVEKLAPQDLREFVAWFEERQGLLNASDALFRMYDEEERAIDSPSRRARWCDLGAG